MCGRERDITIASGYEVRLNSEYIEELKRKFDDRDFRRAEKSKGKYVINVDNKSLSNDLRIFAETQVKRILRSVWSPFLSTAIKYKLSYFSQGENKDDDNIYKLDNFQELQEEESYAIQNIGHATLLIQISGLNILTDPVFNGLNWLFYPEKTKSCPKIDKLPKIDVIIISHNHRDHLDKSSLKTLLHYHKTKDWPLPKIFVPMGDKKLIQGFGFHQVEEVEWFTKITVTSYINGITRSVHFVSVPADHRSGRSLIDHHHSLVCGWVVNPEQENVIFKYAGDTRALIDENQQATDAVLWNEIVDKKINLGKRVENLEIPNIVCFEPSGPNYTRCDMNITHQSTSYSALLKFIEAKNLAMISGKTCQEFLQKIRTVMIHHNKFELGPDRFNEGLFILKKLLTYLDLSKDELYIELTRQEEKLALNLDRKKLKKCIPLVGFLPRQTSLLVHSKDFIVKEIMEVTQKLGCDDDQLLKDYLTKFTTFPKIGERMNNEQILDSELCIESVQKYRRGNRVLVTLD